MNITKKYLKNLEAVLWLTVTILAVGVVASQRSWPKIDIGPAACTQQQAQSAVNVAVRIADDVCSEATQQPNDPAWVTLICSVIDPSSGKADLAKGSVSITIPRVEWVSLKSVQVQSDAGT